MRWLGRLRIRTRLLAGFLAVLCLAGTVAAVAVRRLGEIRATAGQLSDSVIPETRLLVRARFQLADLESHLLHVLLAHDDEPAHRAEIRDIDRSVDATLSRYREMHGPAVRHHPLTALEEHLLHEMVERYAALQEASSRFLRLVAAGQKNTAAALILDEWPRLYAKVIETWDRFLANEDTETRGLAEAAESQARAGRNEVGALMLVAALLSLLLIAAITHSITAPVRQLIWATEQASRGDLRPKGLAPEDPEIGLLARRFDEMLVTLDRTFELQKQFLADASHELRNPLTIIRGEADVALRGPDKPVADYQESLQTITVLAAHMGRLVDELLFLARSNAGQVPYEMAPTELGALLAGVCSQSRGLAGAKGVQVTLGARPPLHVRGDSQRLRQLFMILLDNAIKYTEAGGEVTVAFKSEGEVARVLVSDTGAGIQPHELPFVFERFFRGGAQASKSTEGTGLGLSIAKVIVNAHGGAISIESEPGRETTVTVTLPLADQAD